MPVKACSVSSCKSLAMEGKSQCEKHYQPRKRRKTDRDHIYRGAKWTKIANNHKAKYPICQYCNVAIAEVTDHFVEIQDGGEEYNTDNLVSACHYCHNGRKTRPVKAARSVNQAELVKWYRANAPTERSAEYVETWINNDYGKKQSDPVYI